MEIAKILQRLETNDAADAGIKTAEAQPSDPLPSDTLRTQLREAISDTVKTASAPPAAPAVAPTAPVEGLMKMATDIAAAEDEALLKQAQVYGAAICDGFMTRYAQYEQAATEVAPAAEPANKLASIPQPATQTLADVNFEKFAQDNPELVKEAYDLGYQTKLAALQKEAQERFESGYNDTMEQVHKTAAALYKYGSEWGQWAVKQAEARTQATA